MIHRLLLPRSPALLPSTTASVEIEMPPGQLKVLNESPAQPQAYAELKQLIKQNGLLEKQPWYYASKIAQLVTLLALGVAFLIVVHIFWLQLLDAVYLAFVTTQLGLLGHDAGHRQIFRATWKNDFVGLTVGNLLIGMSQDWWMNKHNKHHSHPNECDLDPDINIPVLSFNPEDIHKGGKFVQFILKHQALFFFPLLFLVALDLQRISIVYLFRTKEKHHFTELSLLLLHFVGYFGLLFTQLNIWQAVLFFLVHQGFSGLYLGSIFAPNHKGMPQLEKNSQLDFLSRQVLTARNVKGSPFIDFLYGGLNYQIEHHLFPSMPRNRLGEAQHLVKAFCAKHSIAYYETGSFRSYGEILQHLHHVSAPLRIRAAKVDV